MKRMTTLTLTIMFGIAGQTFADDGHAQHGKEHHQKMRMEVQGICPVSGEKLGTHGEPVAVTVGPKKEEVFLCCKACLEGKIDAKNWATIHANIVKAQGTCPVMKKPLPKNAEWTVVEGQIVYVCCPPCTDKIERNPTKYLETVDGFYHDSLTAEKN
tara:strand:- start:2503 stop:2973 length:471 start_codon:yes stop_codon:yes gene_type:complete